MNPAERAKAIAALQARRAARGASDPLARLSAAIARAIEDGAEPLEEKTE